MTLTPPESTDDPRDEPLQVQRVVAVRAGGEGDAVAAFGQRARSIASSGGHTFFRILKSIAVLAVVLALLAAWWCENGNVLRSVVAAVLVLIPVAGIGLALAIQQAVGTASIETWRQSGLARGISDLLFAKMAERESSGIGVPLEAAEAQFKETIALWRTDSLGKLGTSGLVGRAQRFLSGLIESAVLQEMRRQADGGMVSVQRVHEALGDRLDDLVALRARQKLRSAVAGAIAASIAWALAVSYLVRAIWR